MAPDDLQKVLAYTMKRNLSAVHLSLADSVHLETQPMTNDSFLAGPNDSIPSTIKEALSSSFVQEWGPAIDRENEGFCQHACFEAVPLPSGARTLPGIWVFTRKRDGSAKARFCVGGHRQIMGRDYFLNKKYCAVLSSRDNRILLALAASESLSVYQTDVVQAFLHGKLDDVDIYIHPPARYPCPPGCLLKLKKAIYGLHQAPVKFKTEVVEWFSHQNYAPANDAQTIWMKCHEGKVFIHALYADDFLRFTHCTNMYNDFQKKL